MIGLGLLGSAMAERLIDGGFRITGYDLNDGRCREFVKLGGQRADTSADAVHGRTRVLLSLPDSSVVGDVLDQIETDLQPGTVVIDTTTGDPDQMASFGQRLAERNTHYLDATVGGSSEQARRCDVTVMAGGERDAFDASRGVLECFARE